MPYKRVFLYKYYEGTWFKIPAIETDLGYVLCFTNKAFDNKLRISKNEGITNPFLAMTKALNELYHEIALKKKELSELKKQYANVTNMKELS